MQKDKSYQWSKILISATSIIIYPIAQIQTLSSILIPSCSSHTTFFLPANYFLGISISTTTTQSEVTIFSPVVYWNSLQRFIFFHSYSLPIHSPSSSRVAFLNVDHVILLVETVIPSQCPKLQLKFSTMSPLTSTYFFDVIFQHSVSYSLSSGHMNLYVSSGIFLAPFV